MSSAYLSTEYKHGLKLCDIYFFIVCLALVMDTNPIFSESFSVVELFRLNHLPSSKSSQTKQLVILLEGRRKFYMTTFSY
jgi:hypothetical protein